LEVIQRSEVIGSLEVNLELNIVLEDEIKVKIEARVFQKLRGLFPEVLKPEFGNLGV